MYTKRAGVVASCLLHSNQYARQYYGEHYNRDIQVQITKFQPSKYIPAIWYSVQIAITHNYIL